MKIYILDDYQRAVEKLECFQLLNGLDVTVLNDSFPDKSALARRIQDAEVLVLIRERTVIDAELLGSLPRLKLISQTGKISNHLDLDACTAHGVALAEGIGSPIAPAELGWALILNAARQLPQAIAAMQRGEWQTNIGSVVQGKRIGIWGYGKIGQRIARYARAFEAEVMVWGSAASRDQAQKDGYRSANDKAMFFETCDIISLHLRLNEHTRNIVGADDLALMKTSAILVNTARAELIAPGALLQALQKGRPGFAALDVYEDEPVLDKNYPLLKLPNVICSPHLGYVEQNSYELYFRRAFENILAFIRKEPQNIAKSAPL